MRKEIT